MIVGSPLVLLLHLVQVYFILFFARCKCSNTLLKCRRSCFFSRNLLMFMDFWRRYRSCRSLHRVPLKNFFRTISGCCHRLLVLPLKNLRFLFGCGRPSSLFISRDFFCIIVSYCRRRLRRVLAAVQVFPTPCVLQPSTSLRVSALVFLILRVLQLRARHQDSFHVIRVFARFRGDRSVVTSQVKHVDCPRVSAVSSVFLSITTKSSCFSVPLGDLKVYCFSGDFLEFVLSATLFCIINHCFMQILLFFWFDP